MAAQHALHLRMARDHTRERVASFQADLVHVADQRGERRVVHDQKRRLVASQGEDLLQPGEPLVVQPPAILACNDGVDRDDAQRPVVDRILHEGIPLAQVGVLRKSRAQRTALVVVAGNEIHRHGKRSEQLAKMGVFLRPPESVRSPVASTRSGRCGRRRISTAQRSSIAAQSTTR